MMTLSNLPVFADKFSIKNSKGIIKEVSEVTADWESTASQLDLPRKVISAIQKMFVTI